MNSNPHHQLMLTREKCKLCNKTVIFKNMRIHVGQHILKQTTYSQPSICEFCGKSTCLVSLVNTSKKRNERKYKVSSTCDYLINFNIKSAEKSSKDMPCCNRPIPCPYDECKQIVWLYNLPSHY